MKVVAFIEPPHADVTEKILEIVGPRISGVTARAVRCRTARVVPKRMLGFVVPNAGRAGPA